jgi:hypothetical protein
MQVRPGHFQPGGIGQGPAVQTMKGVGLEKDVQKPGATYIGNQDNTAAA